MRLGGGDGGGTPGELGTMAALPPASSVAMAAVRPASSVAMAALRQASWGRWRRYPRQAGGYVGGYVRLVMSKMTRRRFHAVLAGVPAAVVAGRIARVGWGQAAGGGTAATGASARGAGTRGAGAAGSGPAAAGAMPVEPMAHDPVMMKEGGNYYVFFTGGLINELRSTDLVHWERMGRALAAVPGWVRTELPANRGDLWAPDIAFYKGKYLLYYAASTFGSRNSGIGLATNKTLDAGSADYKWEDLGLIVRSQQTDNFNAIDPNFVVDEKGVPWLAFGSFWSGIKLRRLTEEGKPDAGDTTVYGLAARRPPATAVEAPFIIHEGRYFYLFVSWDTCCRGLSSTYRVMAGRAEKITGPYVDREKVGMLEGGGTQVLAGDGKRIIGPGGQGLFKDGERWLMVHHFYDGNTANGTARLQVRPVTFDAAGWPVVGKALNSPG